MPEIWEFLPAALRELYHVAPYRAAREGGDFQRLRSDACRDIEGWVTANLACGGYIATGYAPQAAADAKPILVEPRRWNGLRYDLRRNCAVEAITGNVVLIGLDFEWPPLPEPGATAAAPAITPERLAMAMAAARVIVGRDPFRAICRELCPGETIEVMDSVQRTIFGPQPAGPKKKPA